MPEAQVVKLVPNLPSTIVVHDARMRASHIIVPPIAPPPIVAPAAVGLKPKYSTWCIRLRFFEIGT